MNKSDLLPIEHRVQKAIETYFPDHREPRFIIGVSGGPDSMGLLYVLKRLNLGGLVVHINYGKRGEESDKDAELVEQMAFQWGYDCHSLKVDPKKAADKNFQQWARSVRYDIFRNLASEHQAVGIAVAHHQDDQIETILQKQFRGAGLASWSAMNMWDGEIFRPLLHATRKEIEEYVDRNNIPYRTDRSNLRSDFARNFLRNEWLADLERHFPGWRQNVLRMAEQSVLFEEAIDWISHKLKGGNNRFHRESLLDISPRLRKALVLHELKSISSKVQVSGNVLDELDKIDHLQTGKSIQLTENLSLIRDREFFKVIQSASGYHEEIKLELNTFGTEPHKVDDLVFEIGSFQWADFQDRLCLDADKMSWPVIVRRWKEGDRFRPLGMDGHQKVSDHLTNRKVSAAVKSDARVLVSFEDTICAVIFPPADNRVPPGTISELVKCDESTQRCLTIKYSA